jgi:hypothetical protein
LMNVTDHDSRVVRTQGQPRLSDDLCVRSGLLVGDG